MTDVAEASKTARDYYNSGDADAFYAKIWGGEHIHVGLYSDTARGIGEASRRTVEHLANAAGADAGLRVLDMGSGFCGAARYLAREHRCHVVAINLSDVENTRARALNEGAGVGDLIEVIDSAFENMPVDDASFDVVWSQDALLHSGDRPKALAEVQRVLKPGGCFVFTDPMQADDCPDGVLTAILQRLHLSSLASPSFYRATAEALGLVEEVFDDFTPHMVTHYARVLEETERRDEELVKSISRGYLDRMKVGLQHWIDGGERGHLAWGMFRFRKPA